MVRGQMARCRAETSHPGSAMIVAAPCGIVVQESSSSPQRKHNCTLSCQPQPGLSPRAIAPHSGVVLRHRKRRRETGPLGQQTGQWRRCECQGADKVVFSQVLATSKHLPQFMLQTRYLDACLMATRWPTQRDILQAGKIPQTPQEELSQA